MTTSTLPNKNTLRRFLIKAGVICFWLLLWQGISMLVNQELLLPSPIRTLERLWSLSQTLSFWQTGITSLYRIISGCLFGITLGGTLGSLAAFSSLFSAFIQPLITLIKATPVASFIILALVWLRRDNVPAFAASLMILPILFSNVKAGLRETPQELLEMAQVFRFSRTQRMRRIYLPHVRPYFLSACTTALGLAWKAGVAAEVLSIPVRAIGTELYQAKIYLETADLFAWTALVILLSVLLEKGVTAAIARIQRPKYAQEG